GTENIVVARVTDNQLNVVSHVDLDLGSVHACPNRVVIGGLVRANVWMCDAVKYQWKFERMLNGSPYLVNGNPVVIEAYGVNGTRNFYLYGNLGFLAGTEWRVQIRPIFANGVVGSYGTNYQCMKFKGTLAAMPTIENEEEKGREKNLEVMGVNPVVYPNPSHSGSFRIDWLNQDELETSVEIWDAQGRKVGTWKWTETNGHQVDGNQWESGVYQVKITRGRTSHWLRWMKL
ncbi:MAG: T9SS type A sorting domain-containing protein, partial [Bacteroidetes bacterium]|nr:T9SS type A sorting domain-containing protein [Bacteroidota bacterium]